MKTKPKILILLLLLIVLSACQPAPIESEVIVETVVVEVEGETIIETVEVMVEVETSSGEPLAVGDRPPIDGAYPTRVWGVGEVINDFYSLLIPPEILPGRYPLWLGMYDSQTIVRLPVTVDGELQPNNVILAGWLEIE